MTAAGELLLDSPAARPCTHKRPHPHGTLQRYKQDRCRCIPCRDRNAAYENLRRTNGTGYGRWSTWLDANPVRAHVEDVMRETGVGWRTVAARSGLKPRTLRRLLYGLNGKPPARRVTRTTAGALYAIPAGTKAAPLMKLWPERGDAA